MNKPSSTEKEIGTLKALSLLQVRDMDAFTKRCGLSSPDTAAAWSLVMQRLYLRGSLTPRPGNRTGHDNLHLAQERLLRHKWEGSQLGLTLPCNPHLLRRTMFTYYETICVEASLPMRSRRCLESWQTLFDPARMHKWHDGLAMVPRFDR